MGAIEASEGTGETVRHRQGFERESGLRRNDHCTTIRTKGKGQTYENDCSDYWRLHPQLLTDLKIN